jgi:hypothetical protein
MKKIKFLGSRSEQARSPSKDEKRTYTFPKFGKTLQVGETYDEKELGPLGATLLKVGQAVYVAETVKLELKPKLRSKPTFTPDDKGSSGLSGPAKD